MGSGGVSGLYILRQTPADVCRLPRVIDGIILTRHLAAHAVQAGNIDLSTLFLQGINIKEQSTTSTPNLKIQAGWDYALTTSGQSVVTKSITFPVAFTRVVAFVAYPFGEASNSTTVNLMTDLASKFGGANLDSSAKVTLSGADVAIQLRSGTFGTTNERWGFSWIAIGTV